MKYYIIQSELRSRKVEQAWEKGSGARKQKCCGAKAYMEYAEVAAFCADTADVMPLSQACTEVR